MKQLRLPIFNSRIKIYNLRIIPPYGIFNKVMKFKKEFEFLYGKQPLSRSKPHITIATFRMNEKHQDVFLKIFNQLSKKESFKLAIEGFDIFEGSRTLYLGIEKSNTLEAIHKDVQSWYDEHFKRKLKSFYISDRPHMTISKTTGKKMLYESLQHFQKSHYSEQIEVGHLTLVSRSKYKTWDWEHHIKLLEEEES